MIIVRVNAARSLRTISAPNRSRSENDYGPVYTLDGKLLGATPGLTHEDHPEGLVGTNAVAGLAATDHTTVKKFDDALWNSPIWNSPIPSGENRYYDGMLYLMSLMHVSGEFRIWPPKDHQDQEPVR